MKKYRINSVILGFLLIAFAVMLLLNKMGVFTEFPVMKYTMKLILTVILFYIMIVSGFLKKNFLGVTLPLGIIACLFSDLLGISMVSPFIIILVSVLIGIGLSLVFGKQSNVKHDFSGKSTYIGVSGTKEYSDVDGTFSIENSLADRTAYISVNDLRYGEIENGLGSLTVYLNGTTLDSEGATIDIDNGLGRLQLYVPKEFRAVQNIDNGLGSVNTHGAPSTDTNSPLLKLDIDNGLGSVDIYFE